MRVLAMAAEEKLTLKPPRMKKNCHPELERLVACRKSHWNRTMKKKLRESRDYLNGKQENKGIITN